MIPPLRTNLPRLLGLCLLLMPPAGSNAQSYCTPSDICVYDDYIQSFVTSGGFTNISSTNTGCNGAGYAFYSGQTHSAARGSTVHYAFTSNPSWNEYYKIWVDWNSDGDFLDAGEQVYASPGIINYGATVSGSFIIPADATPGDKRLRIRCAFAETALHPCNPSFLGSGETEDYLLSVTPDPCTGTPNAGTIAAAATTLDCNAATSLLLSGNSNAPGMQYQWEYNDGGTWTGFGANTTSLLSPNITHVTEIRCRATCTSPGGGVATTAAVTLHPLIPSLYIGADTTLCPGITYTIGSNDSNIVSYTWSNGGTTPAIAVTNAGTYALEAVFSNGCRNRDTIAITAGMTPLNVMPQSVDLCAGSTTTLNAGNPGATYLWLPGGETTAVKTMAQEGNYNVTVRSMDGCVASFNTQVVLRPLPVASLGSDTSICSGSLLSLDAGNPGYFYSWNTGSAAQSILAGDSGNYTVTIVSPYNCILTDDIHIAYLPTPKVNGFLFSQDINDRTGKITFTPQAPADVLDYEWNFGDNSALSNQPEPVHTYISAGHYDVTLRVYNGCGNFEVAQPVPVKGITRIAATGKENDDIDLYPNPALNLLSLEGKNQGKPLGHITVFNALGAMVYEYDCPAPRHTINVTQLACGIYSARIQNRDELLVKKFEIAR